MIIRSFEVGVGVVTAAKDLVEDERVRWGNLEEERQERMLCCIRNILQEFV